MAADLSKISILARREIEARILSPVIAAFIQEVGKERALQIFEPIIQSLARESGRQLAKWMDGNSLEAFARGMDLWTREDALQLEIIEQNPKRFAFNVTRCRYADMYQELGILEFGKILSCNRDAALIEGMNPKIRFTRTQTIMEGAPFCDFRYETKD
ncbi:MAG: L-2-amino-thiazoline-4-carboxylic acid hydrolase [Deltaproteobacteria bacterium]|nr:L-2-amino-thiazoline-4-carboxylic acid hydrolase [Deltaproteobacteria bacterium]